MYRVLETCKASTRKSLQGLDYFIADGAKAFDDLVTVVEKMASLGKDHEWVHDIKERLKAGKQYLKADYKVSSLPIFLCCKTIKRASARKMFRRHHC